MDANVTRRTSTARLYAPSRLPSDESNQDDLEMLEGLPFLLERLSDSQKEALLNATQLDESMLFQLSSKFIFSKSCDDNDNPLSSPSLQHGVLHNFDHGRVSEIPRELQFQKLILMYAPIFIYVIGVVGNCLSFSVLIRRRMRRVSTYRYLAVLSIVDTVVLTLGLLQLWTGEVAGTSIRSHSDFSCKVVNALGYTVSDLSVWLIIAVTVERFVAVCYPLKAATTCRSKTAVKVIVVLLVVMLAINVNFFWTTKIQIYETKGPATLVLTETGAIIQCPTKNYIQKQCTAAEGYDFLVEKVWPWLDAIIYSFLPFVIIIILNSLIISRVVSARRKRCRMTSQFSATSLNRIDTGKTQPLQVTQMQQEKSPRIMQKLFLAKHQGACCSSTRDAVETDRQTQQTPTYSGSGGGRRDTSETNLMLSFMLLTISFAFLLMTLPMNIMLIINNIWNTSSPSNHDPHQWAKYQLASTVTELLMYLNHSTNFFLYCATGQKFRVELKRMIAGWRTSLSCSKICCLRNRRSSLQEGRRRERRFDWSLQNHDANQTIRDKLHVNQTIIMNIIPGQDA